MTGAPYDCRRGPRPGDVIVNEAEIAVRFSDEWWWRWHEAHRANDGTPGRAAAEGRAYRRWRLWCALRDDVEAVP